MTDSDDDVDPETRKKIRANYVDVMTQRISWTEGQLRELKLRDEALIKCLRCSSFYARGLMCGKCYGDK